MNGRRPNMLGTEKGDLKKDEYKVQMKDWNMGSIKGSFFNVSKEQLKRKL